MNQPVNMIAVSGFDPEGEPEIRVMADGGLYVVFNFMPPSWAEDNPDPFDDFDRQLSQAIGLPVEWEDREFFRVGRPAPDTVERIRRFRPTVLINVPTMIHKMVAHPLAADQDLSCVRICTSAGEALPAELDRRWRDTFGVELLDEDSPGAGVTGMIVVVVVTSPAVLIPFGGVVVVAAAPRLGWSARGEKMTGVLISFSVLLPTPVTAMLSGPAASVAIPYAA